MHPDPRAWRPQSFGRRLPRKLRDPLIEPAWDGIRILAHVAPAGVRLVYAGGADLAPGHPEIVAELAAGGLADTLVVDGYLTDQVLLPGTGVGLDAEETPGLGEHMTQFLMGKPVADQLGGRGRLPGRPTARTVSLVEAAAGGEPVPIAFVAVDLVALDDQPLLEVPLLERKRLLESVLREGPRVRRTPFVREPAGSFIRTWRSLGFGGLAYKEANSRYHPGAPNDAWSLISMPRR
jgi:ATP-dependent DNA ligase